METYTAYTSIPKKRLVSSGVDWGELSDYIQKIGPIVDDITAEQGVDEAPPQVQYGEEFDPKGWVGTYPGGVKVEPDKIDHETYSSLLSGASGLIESFGLRTATAGLPFSPDTLDDARSQYLAYSRQLIQLTNTILNNRLPVTVHRETHIGRETVGSINVQRTIREQARQSGRIASVKTIFSIDTPVVRLLYRFHSDLQRRLSELRQDYGLDDPKLQRQEKYHQRLRRVELPGAATDKDTNITNDELATLRESPQAPIRDVANLWVAFRRNQAMDIDWEQQLESAIKPISAVYELWCLDVILDILENLFGGYQCNNLNRVPSVYEFNTAGVTLYYDRSVASCSSYVTEHFKPEANSQAGNPDFLLAESTDSAEKDEVARWVADAKFQEADDLDTSGVLRFLAYIVDYLEGGGDRGTLLCIGGDPGNPSKTIESRESRIRTVGPESLSTVKNRLQEDITMAMRSEIHSY